MIIQESYCPTFSQRVRNYKQNLYMNTEVILILTKKIS